MFDMPRFKAILNAQQAVLIAIMIQQFDTELAHTIYFERSTESLALLNFGET